MTPDINIMRDYVQSLYSGPGWKRRVRNMRDDEVTAIYFKSKRKEEEKAQEDKKESGDAELPF